MRSIRWTIVAALAVTACKLPGVHYRDGDGDDGGESGSPGICPPFSFSPSVALPTDMGPYSIAVADLNHDSWPDLVVVSQVGTVSVLLNRKGSFPTIKNYMTGQTPHAVIASDLDHDGWPDLIVANSGENSVGVLLNVGSTVPGSFKTMQKYSTTGNPSSIAVADFGEGPDLMVTDMNAGGKLTVLLNSGTGTFDFPPNLNLSTAANGEPAAIAVADLDGGPRDLVVANRDVSSLTVLLGDSQGGYQTHSERPVGSGQIAIAVADLDGQHHDDVVVANHNAGLVTNGVTVLLNDGTGEFSRRSYTTGANPQALALADLDGDGLADLVVANHDDDSVSVLLGAAGGTFLNKTDVKTGGTGPQSVAVADVNNDTFPDIIAANNTSNTITVLLACPR